MSGEAVAYRQLSWYCPELRGQVDVTVRSCRLELSERYLDEVARSALCHDGASLPPAARR